MNAAAFAEWLRLQDHRVVRSKSTYWFDQGPRVFQAFPFHWIIKPSESELNQVLHEQKAFGLRYSAPADFSKGQISYHAVYVNGTYGLEKLGKWARKNVRRGLRNAVVEPISFNRMVDEGWQLQVDTLDRQGRKLGITEEIWRKRCLAAASLPGFDAWGALLDGKLAASVITFLMQDCAYMLYQQCHRDYLRDHVNNALSFVVTRELISRPEVNSVFYGLHSLDAPPSVDEFKFRMGYVARPVRQRVVFHPRLAPLFNRASHAALAQLLRVWPGNATLAKAEGMVRFYLEGGRPLHKQSWPPPLEVNRADVEALLF